MAAFLSFLSADISRTPERVRPLAETRIKIKKARELTKGTKIRDDVALPDDLTL
jgi:hypothetical protein